MTSRALRTVFLVDAAYSLITGLIFLAGTWDGLYDALEWVQPRPGINTQFAGALLLGFAYLLWEAAKAPPQSLAVARAALIANALSVGIIVAWLVDGGLEASIRAEVQLGVAAAISAGLATAYLLATSRGVRDDDQRLRSGA